MTKKFIINTIILNVLKVVLKPLNIIFYQCLHDHLFIMKNYFFHIIELLNFYIDEVFHNVFTYWLVFFFIMFI